MTIDRTDVSRAMRRRKLIATDPSPGPLSIDGIDARAGSMNSTRERRCSPIAAMRSCCGG